MPAAVMDPLLSDLNIPHACDVPLGSKTWYHVGGNARILARPESVDQLSQLATRCHSEGVPIYVLGSGANLLVADKGVDGVVVLLDQPAFKNVSLDPKRPTVGAGVDLMKLVLATAKAGLVGLEVLAGIPATVGGAICMNAGGAYGDIGKSVRRVTVMDDQGHITQLNRKDLRFEYRKTNIAQRFILEVEFDLDEMDPDELGKKVKEIFLYKKNTQPLGDNSAGCTFKNPASDNGEPLPPAGKLIDDANLKGHTIGGAQVSDRHANFIVCDKQCTADDVLALIEHVQATVLERMGVQLQREVVIWP